MSNDGFILVTGGAGYIGSHIVLELLKNSKKVIVFDNLISGSKIAMERVLEYTGHTIEFVEGDIRNKEDLASVFSQWNISSVIHLAGLKSVSESVELPLSYYDTNVSGTLNLLRTMEEAEVRNLIFSSSATVYGTPDELPVSEIAPLNRPLNPYGMSKLMVEEILVDLCKSNKNWSVGVLRYFNPVGAHPSGIIGEDPSGIPNNLFPYITQTALQLRDKLQIFGGDYPTVDGTGVRDYIHVVDLAVGHLSALAFIESAEGHNVWNLGAGKGISVLEAVREFIDSNNVDVPFEIVARRTGDVAESWADITKAKRELGWLPSLTLKDMVADAWNWQVKNPTGYQ